MYKVVMIVLIIAIICDLVNSKSNNDGNKGNTMISYNKSYQRRVALNSNSTIESSSKTLPIDLSKQINNMTNIDDLFAIVKGVPDFEKSSFFTDRIGVERASGSIAEPAGCIPALEVVPLSPNAKNGDIYFPSCTRVNRCSGCCNHKLLICQPTQTRLVNFLVAIIRYIDNTLVYQNTGIVPVEVHDACTCKCNITSKHCNHYQVYKENECSCVCFNTDDEEKCKNVSATKVWDSDKCECGCRNTSLCPDESDLNKDTCRCQLKSNSSDTYTSSERSVTLPISADFMPRRKHKDEPISK